MRLVLPASPWSFPDPDEVGEVECVAQGADWEPATLLNAYAQGYFPMPGPGGSPAWFLPLRRGVLPLDNLHVSRSLRRSLRRFEVTVDEDFDAVVAACADPRREHGWINDDVRAAYGRLHELGWAHSVEVRRDGELVGGLYGINIGGLFAGESKFHLVTDASKAAVAATVTILDDGWARVFDVQWQTEHLATLGVVEVARSDYLADLPTVLEQPPVQWRVPRDWRERR